MQRLTTTTTSSNNNSSTITTTTTSSSPAVKNTELHNAYHMVRWLSLSSLTNYEGVVSQGLRSWPVSWILLQTGSHKRLEGLAERPSALKAGWGVARDDEKHTHRVKLCMWGLATRHLRGRGCKDTGTPVNASAVMSDMDGTAGHE